MRKLRFALPVFLLAAASLFATDIPRGTKITVRTNTMVTSDRSFVGDPVDVVLVNDLVVNGKLIARKGAAAQGTISAVEPSTRGKVDLPGSVSIRLETLETPEGTYHLSTNEYTRQGRGRSRSPIPQGTGGGISVDSVGGVQRQSPFPVPDATAVTLATGGLEATIPPESIITFKVAAVSSSVPKK